MVIDYKYTGWSRMTIPEGIDKKKLIKWIDEKLTPLEIYDEIHELDASVSIDILYDTEEYITPEDNLDKRRIFTHTIELLDDEFNTIYDNVNGKHNGSKK